MGDYLLVCVLVLNMIMLSKTWPHNKREDSAMGTKRDKNDADIIFPDVTTKAPPSIYSATGKGTNCIDGLCLDAKDYPYKRIAEISDKLDVYGKLFGSVEGAVVNTTSRFQGGKEVSTMCGSTITTVFPKTMKNENDTERFIINSKEKTQGLVYETCIKGAKCQFESLFPSEYTSECTQKYAKRRLATLEEDGNPGFDTFVVPSCCVCTITQKEKKN